MKHIRIITLTAALFAFHSCTHQQKGQIGQSDTLLDKTISFPQSLLVLDGERFHRIDSLFPAIDGKPKVISIVDGNCMSCVINQLNGVDSIFQDAIHDKCLFIIVLNVQRKDSTFFMRHLQPSIRAKGIILWDNGYNFERYNKLLTPDVNLRTFMVNGEDRIVQYGNPIFHPDVLTKYKEKLASLMRAKS